jgi:hypothetical protein
MLPADGAAGLHLTRARRLVRRSCIDCLIGLAVAFAGCGEMVTSLLFVRSYTLLDWLIRVQGLSLIGLFASAWGCALLDQSWHRLRAARAACRAIRGGEAGWAFALAGLEQSADRHA